jgi:hypothetical protein
MDSAPGRLTAAARPNAQLIDAPLFSKRVQLVPSGLGGDRSVAARRRL